MSASVGQQSRTCIGTLKLIITTLQQPDYHDGRVRDDQITNELERFSLWVGNIGALHHPDSSMSLESRLREAGDVLAHILDLLEDLHEVASESE